LKNTPKVRKILFGRKNLKSGSFFEKFWSMKLEPDVTDEEQYFQCAYYFWNEFRLWEKPEMLTMVGFFTIL
jgi:hypothetical protein